MWIYIYGYGQGQDLKSVFLERIFSLEVEKIKMERRDMIQSSKDERKLV